MTMQKKVVDPLSNPLAAKNTNQLLQTGLPQTAKTPKRNSREYMTEIMRNMHKERVMVQLHQNFEAHSVHFNVKPDFAGLLSKKFSSFNDEIAQDVDTMQLVEEIQPNDKNEEGKESVPDASKSESEDEESSVPSLARGRKLQEAACLRITRIEKVLATRTDLSMAERRSLRARKNTANFRERRKIANDLKHFHTIELDTILR